MSNEINAVLEFGDYQFDTNQGLLLRGGDIIPLAPKAFLTLRVLLESQGRVVEKEELLKKIWPDTFVEDGSLTQNISILRRHSAITRMERNSSRPYRSEAIDLLCRYMRHRSRS